MRDGSDGEEKRDYIYPRPHHEGAQNSGRDKTENNLKVGKRSGQNFLNVPREALEIKRGGSLHKGGLHHVHHQKPRNHEINVVDAGNLTDSPPHNLAEDENIKQSRNPRGKKRLIPHAHKSLYFLPDESYKADEVHTEAPFRSSSA